MDFNFFRFQSFSARALDAVCNDKLFFSSPADFNDPFDCRPAVEADSTLNELRELLKALVFRRVTAETKDALKTAFLTGGEALQTHAEVIGIRVSDELLRELRWHAETMDDEADPDLVMRYQLTYHIEKELLLQYSSGVCCFSDNAVNPLLWSHYGDQHRGICIGYNIDRRPPPDLKRVRYVNDRSVRTSLIYDAVVRQERESIFDLDDAVLLRKSPHWSYESEWRLIGKRGLWDSALRMKDVIFGMRCELGLMYTLMQALAPRKDVQFWQIREKARTYELELIPFNESYFEGRFPARAESGEEMFGDMPSLSPMPAHTNN